MSGKHWFTETLALKVREAFEPKYGRKLFDSEVVEIASSLSSLVEIYVKKQIKDKYGEK